jgi:hypothetical protein
MRFSRLKVVLLMNIYEAVIYDRLMSAENEQFFWSARARLNIFCNWLEVIGSGWGKVK